MLRHRYFHYAYYTLGYRHAYNWGAGVFIWLFLSATQPFGIGNATLQEFTTLLGQLWCFGLLFPLIGYGVDAVGRWCRRAPAFDPKTDAVVTVVKLLLLIHGFWATRELRCSGQCVDASEYGQLWLACTLLTSFAYFPMLLLGRSHYFQAMAGQLSAKPQGTELHGSGKERLRVDVTQVLWLQADDNYVDVYQLTAAGTVEKGTLRGTLKSLEEQLSSYPQFQRIHRSYLVNLQYAREATATQLTLAWAGGEQPMPVSAKYKEVVHDWLAAAQASAR